MAKTYVKKPIPIEAVQFDGKNLKEIQKFMGIEEGRGIWYRENLVTMKLDENTTTAAVNDYVMKNEDGTFRFFNQEEFEKIYMETEVVTENPEIVTEKTDRKMKKDKKSKDNEERVIEEDGFETENEE